MLLRRRVFATGLPPPTEIPDPLQVELPGGGRATLTQRAEPGDYLLTIEESVDSSQLELEPASGFYRTSASGERVDLPRVRVPADAVAGEYGAEDLFDALSLLTDEPFTLYSVPLEPDELVPESAGDIELLDATFARAMCTRRSARRSTAARSTSR